MNPSQIKKVKRGFIMRFHPDEYFDRELFLVPKNVELFDSDAVPYYIDRGDGSPLVEYYGHRSPTDYDIYATEDYQETLDYFDECYKKINRTSKWKEKFNKAFD
jgi:hypothetical protein